MAELSDTPLTPVEVIEKHSHFGSSGANTSSRGNPSLGFSSVGATDHASMVSSNSAAGGAVAASSSRNLLPSSTSQPPRDVRSDSPAIPGASTYDNDHAPGPTTSPDTSQPAPSSNNNPDGGGGDIAPVTAAGVTSTPPPQPAPRGDSGISAFSERDRAHLRNVSDPATVSTMDGTVVGSPRIAPQQVPGRVVSPEPIAEEEGAAGPALGGHPSPPAMVSPPTGGEADGEDYVSSRSRSDAVSPVNRTATGHGASSSPARKSVFRESREDMGGAR